MDEISWEDRYGKQYAEMGRSELGYQGHLGKLMGAFEVVLRKSQGPKGPGANKDLEVPAYWRLHGLGVNLVGVICCVSWLGLPGEAKQA